MLLSQETRKNQRVTASTQMVTASTQRVTVSTQRVIASTKSLGQQKRQAKKDAKRAEKKWIERMAQVQEQVTHFEEELKRNTSPFQQFEKEIEDLTQRLNNETMWLEENKDILEPNGRSQRVLLWQQKRCQDLDLSNMDWQNMQNAYNVMTNKPERDDDDKVMLYAIDDRAEFSDTCDEIYERCCEVKEQTANMSWDLRHAQTRLGRKRTKIIWCRENLEWIQTWQNQLTKTQQQWREFDNHTMCWKQQEIDMRMECAYDEDDMDTEDNIREKKERRNCRAKNINEFNGDSPEQIRADRRARRRALQEIR